MNYFLLSRNIFESAIWSDDPNILKLFIYLIGKARYLKESKKYPHFNVKRGELVTSLALISDNNEYMRRGRLAKWSRAKVSRMIKTLENQGYIKVLADTYGTHISICNYGTYQNPDSYKANTSETVPNTSETEVRTLKEGLTTNNKDNKGEKTFTGNDISESEYPSLEDYQLYYMKYAKKKYSNEFNVSELKCNSFAENDFIYWKNEKWKRKKNMIKSIKQTIETAVRNQNGKLKDWDIESKPNSLKKRSYDE